MRDKIVKLAYFKEEGLGVPREVEESGVAGSVHKHPVRMFSTETGRIICQGVSH